MNNNVLFHKNLIKTIAEVKELNTVSFDAYSVKILVDFLKTSHKRFLNQSIPQIEQNFLLLTKYYDENNDLKTIFNLFIKFQIDFMEHIQLEEKTVFPYADTLYHASIGSSIEAVVLIHLSEYSIADFANSHENKECYLTEIIFLLSKQKQLKNHSIFNILIKQICQLDNEIKTHAWIEDNVLVKKVKEIEYAFENFVKSSQN